MTLYSARVWLASHTWRCFCLYWWSRVKRFFENRNQVPKPLLSQGKWVQENENITLHTSFLMHMISHRFCFCTISRPRCSLKPQISNVYDNLSCWYLRNQLNMPKTDKLWNGQEDPNQKSILETLILTKKAPKAQRLWHILILRQNSWWGLKSSAESKLFEMSQLNIQQQQARPGISYSSKYFYMF